MPRGRRVALANRDLDINRAIENLAVHHIVAVRRRRGGEILQVKHITFGWISVATYARMSLIKSAQPVILEVIRGGYQLKAWIWSTQIPLDVLASGFALPFGIVIVSVAFILYALDVAGGNQTFAVIDLLALALPWGELWLLVRGLDYFFNFVKPDASGLPSWTSNGYIDIALSLFGGGVPLALYGESQIVGQGVEALYSYLASKL